MSEVDEGDHRTRSLALTRQDIARYAGASGDFNLPHVDEPFAERAGYDSVIVMGMLPAGIAGSMVQDWLGRDGIRSFEVRFEAVVYPGDELEFVAEIERITEDGVAVVTIDVTNQDNESVLVGETTVRLPSR
ncbi:MAG: acyl dehydratase [Natrialbaceae archaeon]|jgi:acyl dehydratase